MKPRAKEPERNKYIVPAVAALVLLAGAFGIYRVVTGESPKRRVLDTVAIKLVPPPPPEIKPPPEPPKLVEEQKIEQPVDKPMDQPKDEPPPGPLALDAKAGPGSDSFGLGGKLGGADFLGGGGGGTRFGHFTILLTNRLQEQLREDDRLRKAKYNTSIRIWIADTGKVRVQLLHTTGDKDTDDRIEQSINGMSVLAEPPPKDMRQPIILSIAAQPGLG